MFGDGLPRISVIASNFNGARYLPRLIETLRAQRGVSVQIIIVDRESTDESQAILAAHPEVAVVTEPPASGLCSGYHAGVAAAQHPLLFFCNEDIWLDLECLATLAAGLSAADIGAVDPWQWTYDGTTLVHAGTRFVAARGYQNGPDPDRAIDFVVPVAPGETIAAANAAAMLIRRDVYEAIGGWDRSFFLDGEDLDLFIRFWQAGWRVVSAPGAKVYHAVNVSNTKVLPGQVPVGRRRYLSARSSVLVMAVKYMPVSRIAWVGLLWAGASLRRLLLGRFTQFGWDLSALREFAGRLGPALAYRRAHKNLNRRRPAAKFFRATEFQR